MALGNQESNKKLLEEFMDVMTKLRKVMMNISSNSTDYSPATGLQYRGLFLINETPGITVGDLAQKCLMSSASVTQFVRRLEDSGWIKKETDQNDKRVSHLLVTESGQEELKKMKKIFSDKLQGILSLLPESDIVDLIRIQKKLLINLENKQKNDQNN